MTDLESAVLDVLRRARPEAMTLSDIHAKLVGRGWDVHLILPHNIMSALIALTDAGLVGNELSWHALPDAPEPKP